MKKLIYKLVSIFGLIIIGLCNCMTMYDIPKKSGPVAEEVFDIVEYQNYPALATLYPKYKSHKLGLIDADFKKYVMEQIKGTDYVGEPRWYEVDRMDMTFIGWAYVYYKKDTTTFNVLHVGWSGI